MNWIVESYTVNITRNKLNIIYYVYMDEAKKKTTTTTTKKLHIIKRCAFKLINQAPISIINITSSIQINDQWWMMMIIIVLNLINLYE